jgi:hypothetical protein
MLTRIDSKTFIGAFTTFSIILLILFSENPAAPPSLFKIENGDVRVEAYDKSGDIIASVFLNDTELFVISGKNSGIMVNNKKISMSSMFNGLKKVEVSDKERYKELKVYYSENKNRTGFVFRLWNNSKLEVLPFAEIENKSIGIVETSFLYKVKLEKIQQNGIFQDRGNFVWKAEDYYIPKINTYQDIYYGSGLLRLTYEGAVRVENRIKDGITSVSLPRTHGAYPSLMFDFSPELRSPPGMVISAAKDITSNNIHVYYNGTLLFKLNPSLSVLQYNKKYLAVFGARNSFFNFNDEKLGTIRQLNDGYELEIRWANKSKDPSKIGYRIAVRNNNSVNISMFVVSKYPERIGRTAYVIQYSGVDRIVTPHFRVIDTTSRSNVIERFDEFRIPIQVSTDSEKLIYGDAGYSLELTSKMEQVDNLVKNKAVKVSISNYTLGKHLNFTSISFRVSNDTSYPESNSTSNPYSILTTENVNDGNVRIYYNNTQILRFRGWEAIFSFNNSVKRLSVPSKRKNIGLFTEYDSKRVIISENNDSYTLRVSWYNKTKDPYEAGWLFTLPKNNSYIKIEPFFNSTYKLDGLAPGFKLLKNYDVYLPDSMLKNDKKSSRLANTRYAAFQNTSSVILVYSPSLAYLRSYFRYQVFRPVFLDPAPLYLEYFPEANLSYYGGSLHLSTPFYSGSVKEYINRSLPPSDEINTTRVLQLQGKLALEPVEIRGPVFNISAGNKVTIKPAVFPGYEDYSLELNFSGDGWVEKSGAKYTAKANKDKRIWFLDQYYQSLDTNRIDLLSKIYLSKKNFTLMHDKPYTMRDGYSLELIDVSEKGESVFIRLLKNDEILDESIIQKKEKYSYNRSINDRNLTVVSFIVDDAFHGTNGSMAIIKNLYQYSDEPLEIKVGDKFGRFQVTSITDEKIIMENIEPLTFPKGEKTLILDDTIGFNVSNVWKAYVFRNEKLPGKHRARGIFYKGGWYPATKGSVLSFNASNFSGFHYDFEKDISYESFTASFSADGEIGSATYTVYIHNGTTWFMGEEYNVFGKVLTKKIFDDHVSIQTDKPLKLADGYVLSLKDVSERSSSAMLVLKKNGKIVKSDVVEKRDVFSYDKKIGGKNIPVITAKIDGILRGRKEGLVTMNLKQYSDNPFEIKSGDKYDSFEVDQINSNKITLKLSKKISISKNTVVNVLGEYLKFQVKNDEWKVYPFVEIKAKKAGVI